MMLKPVIIVSKELESGLREEYEKTPGHIVWVKPDPREEIRCPSCPSAKILATPKSAKRQRSVRPSGRPFPCTNHCCLADAAALQWGMPRPQKITFGEMTLLRRARSPDLLLRLSLQPFDRDQRRSMA